MDNTSDEDEDITNLINNRSRTSNNSRNNTDKPANNNKEKIFNNNFSNSTWDVLNGAVDGISKILKKL